MNVTFHVLTGFAVAGALSRRTVMSSGSTLVAGMAASMGFHGLLDYIPHSYPINSRLDVFLALFGFGLALLFAKSDIRLLLTTCFLGSILPDLIDLAPGILNRHFGLRLPEVKFFPWHWSRYSGSIYDGTRRTESVAAHAAVLTATLSMIWLARDRLFAVRTRTPSK